MEQMLVGAVVAQLTLSNSWEPCVTHIKESGRLCVHPPSGAQNHIYAPFCMSDFLRGVNLQCTCHGASLYAKPFVELLYHRCKMHEKQLKD